MSKAATNGPLTGIRVLDMTRILAGPGCTQLLGDMGAEIIKIERPGRGDDTRSWGPPFMKSNDGEDAPGMSAYYLAANRNKSSLAVAMDRAEGQKILRDIARQCDVVIENFKTDNLQKYQLDYPSLQAINAGLIYCSITGFGQTGPNRTRPGYDFLVQGMSGLMSITGEPDGEPQKYGVAITDMMSGMYASSAILAALYRRSIDGLGEYIDLSLVDVGLSMLANQGSSYLQTGKTPKKIGNTHATIVPYQVFSCHDGLVIITAGNDGQFANLCAYLQCAHLAKDARFATNESRVRNRDILVPILQEKLKPLTRDAIIDGLENMGVPVGPLNNIAQALNGVQCQSRNMRTTLSDEQAQDGQVEMIGNPIKFARNRVSYRKSPPRLGEDSQQILRDILGLDPDEIAQLIAQDVIGVLD